MRAEPAPVTATQAIAYMNRQRAANGIPPTLADDPAMSQGCWNHTNLYEDARDQFPHIELPSQPGFTEAGKKAASNSNLGGGAGWWSELSNPWSHAPLHHELLLQPWATLAWYGETDPSRGRSAVCMGTSSAGPDSPLYSPDAFYS